MKTIEIIISPAGQTRLETKGFAGRSCQAASRFLELALGEKLAETAKAEAHQSVQQQIREREKL